MAHGFGREPSLEAVRREPSGSCRDLCPLVPAGAVSSEIAPFGPRVLHRDLRSLRSEAVGVGAPAATELDAGSRLLTYHGQTRKGLVGTGVDNGIG